MAWKPGNTSQLDLGEIPHKRQISDEEFANMRANAPDREEHQAAMEYEKRQQTILEDIISAGDDAVDALTLITDLQDNEEMGIGPMVLDDGFVDAVETKLEERHSPLDIDTVIEVWYKKELTPEMFYFGIGMDNNNNPYVTLVSIPYWEENGCLDDRGLEDHVAPGFLGRLMEATYEIIDKTPSQARRDLVKLGFIENHEIIT